jgi:hypothetical protein
MKDSNCRQMKTNRYPLSTNDEHRLITVQVDCVFSLIIVACLRVRSFSTFHREKHNRLRRTLRVVSLAVSSPNYHRALFMTNKIVCSRLPDQLKFDRSDETVSVVVGKRALLPCYVSIQEVNNNNNPNQLGQGPFKVILVGRHRRTH